MLLSRDFFYLTPMPPLIFVSESFQKATYKALLLPGKNQQAKSRSVSQLMPSSGKPTECLDVLKHERDTAPKRVVKKRAQKESASPIKNSSAKVPRILVMVQPENQNSVEVISLSSNSDVM